jgi:hypothetical protein
MCSTLVLPLVLPLPLQEVLLLIDPEEQPLGSMQQGDLAPAACAALTASNVLHTLDLHHAELPPGAWAHMFPAGRRLPALRSLVLSDPDQRMTDAEFEQLVRCCPGLTGVTLLRALEWGVTLEPLLQLPQLQEIELRHLHGDSAMRLYEQMTNLRRLHNDDANVSMAGLSRLTALKRLTHLHMHCSPDQWSLPRPISISNQVGGVGKYTAAWAVHQQVLGHPVFTGVVYCRKLCAAFTTDSICGQHNQVGRDSRQTVCNYAVK